MIIKKIIFNVLKILNKKLIIYNKENNNDTLNVLISCKLTLIYFFNFLDLIGCLVGYFINYLNVWLAQKINIYR